jgi:hypothetical protein
MMASAARIMAIMRCTFTFLGAGPVVERGGSPSCSGGEGHCAPEKPVQRPIYVAKPGIASQALYEFVRRALSLAAESPESLWAKPESF